MPIGNTCNHTQIYDDYLHFFVIFIEICVTVLLLFSHPLMTSIYFIFEDPTLNKTSETYLIFMFRLMFIFRILFIWKATFSHLSISPLESCTNEFRVFEGLHQTQIKAKTTFSSVHTWNMSIKDRDIHIPIYFSALIMNFSLIWVLCI